MEGLIKNLSEKIAIQLNYDDDKKEVIAYGIFAIVQTLLSIVLVIIFGVLFHIVLEALIISFTTSILRKYSGGAHASSPEACITAGTILCIGQALLITFLISPVIDLNMVVVLGLLTFALSYYIVYKLAPVDSSAKPIRKQEKRKRMKKGSILILSVYLVIVLINIAVYLYIGKLKIITFVLCIYGGTLWQVFTLTRVGHLVLGKVDTFFNQIIFDKRR